MDVPQNWSFNLPDVASNFDTHVREQLPWYELATSATAHLARHFIPDGGLVYDIGAATGNIGRALASTLAARSASLVAIEPAPEMVIRYDAPGDVVRSKAEDFDYQPFDFAVLFLTLMFVEPRKRHNLMARLRLACRPGGAIVVFDKLEPVGGYLSTVLYRLALAGKLANGVSAEEILSKELSLSGVQRPILEEQLGGDTSMWFRFGDFAGWIIERPAYTSADHPYSNG
jgi:tRNA (cmo5U34)-methyltransferase